MATHQLARLTQRLRHGMWLALFLTTAAVHAQQEPAFVQYWDMEPQYNPAAAGRSDQLSINAAYQVHAAGYTDAGGTMYAGADIALQFGNTRHGLGAIFMNDAIGIFSHKRFSLQYSYHFNLFGGKMSAGAEVDMLSETIDGSDATFPEQGSDPAIPATSVSGSKFDLSVGLWYTHKKWYAGVSMLHATSPTVNLGETNQYHYHAVYQLTGGYIWQLRNKALSLRPSTMLRYDGTDFRADLTMRLVWQREKNTFQAGLNYSPQHSVAAFLGATIHGLVIGYAYEVNTSGMGLGNGNHEITLGYRLPLNLQKRGKNLHKSVRYL